MVFAWRSAGGKATSERSSALFWLAIAPSAWFAFAVSAERSLRRWRDRAEGLRALDEELAEAPAGRCVSSANRRWVAASAGAKYL